MADGLSPDPPKRGPGRPRIHHPGEGRRKSKYTRPLGDKVLDLIAGTERPQPLTLRAACRELSLSPSTVRWWVVQDTDGFAKRYLAARGLLLDHWADEMVDIADDGTGDDITDKTGRKRTNHDAINRSRLRVETRRWLMSKLRPGTYGDKVEAEAKGPVVFVIGLQQPRHDPLADVPPALPAAQDEEEDETGETVMDLSRIIEQFGRPRNGANGPAA